ncbi:uncharacterized protein LOC123564336 [Mercenaria mercenaria]|uniref:uncharacterized protein LOC123564336 n=1 Tax=Mercenaria mercenaria TaxID=6596 RepID=UPI001E1DA3AB|nr:uncharacterized protein LOC123564336 [Mercenaria mercenaria]
MATRFVTLELTSEQTDAIKTLFLQNNWSYCEVKSEGKNITRKRKKTMCASTAEASISSYGQATDDKDQGEPNHDPDPEDPNNDSDPSDGNDDSKCIHCYMSPCVTVSQIHLGGEGQEPSEYNPPIRKSIYKRFWRVIDNLGGWKLLPYQNKKRELAQRQNVVYCKREVMPECVLLFTRGLYPNPDGQPYMGHKWE